VINAVSAPPQLPSAVWLEPSGDPGLLVGSGDPGGVS